MNKERHGGSPNRRLLLLIPAALMIAKGMRHRRAMWESGWGPSGAAAHGHGHFARHGAGDATAEDRGAFRLPPRIEWMLDSWHTRAHQNAEAADTTTV
jgi:hypothetical protein